MSKNIILRFFENLAKEHEGCQKPVSEHIEHSPMGLKVPQGEGE